MDRPTCDHLLANAKKRCVMLVKTAAVGKTCGGVGIDDKAQIWSDGGHSKSAWFIVSSCIPHLVHSGSICIPRFRNCAPTDTQPVTICHRKWFNFEGHRTVQACACNLRISGPIGTMLTSSGYCCAVRYPDLTVYLLDLVKHHPSVSGRCANVVGIPFISDTSELSKNCRNSGKFHVEV